MNYNETIDAIRQACNTINLCYTDTNCDDGRITSAVKEKEYLDALDIELKKKDPSIIIERPKERWWYDVRINNIPINLKLTTGCTDNAFNKVAIIYTLTGTETSKKNMNYDVWYSAIKSAPRKQVRDHATEYHYLVVNKNDGQILLKSILDIHTYKTNPCNILQINWTSEFKNREFAILDQNFREKEGELLKAIQKSIIQSIRSMTLFANANLDDECEEEVDVIVPPMEPSHSTIASDPL